MSYLRTTARLFEAIQHVPALLPAEGAQRRIAGRGEGVMVIALIVREGAR